MLTLLVVFNSIGDIILLVKVYGIASHVNGDSIFSLTLKGDNVLFCSSQGSIKGGRNICNMPWSFNSKLIMHVLKLGSSNSF